MIRLGTLIWLTLAGAMIAGLYYMKNEVQTREQRLEAIKEEIRQDREAIEVLRAEWSHLNNPERLTRLNAQFLRLRPIDRARLLRDVEDAIGGVDPVERVRHLTGEMRRRESRRNE